MRLQRIGRKNDPSYRVVVTDSRRGPKSGDNVDLLGSYNPKMNVLKIDGERAKDWISKGVQTSGTVHNLLVSEKIIEGKKVNVLPKKTPIVSDTPAEEAPAPVAEASADTETPEDDATETPTEEASTAETETAEEGKEESPAAEEATEEAPEAEATAPETEEEKS